MTAAALVLRPEPGNSRTADRLREGGLVVHQLPLFAVRPLAWTAPDPAGWDGLLVTSANAVRHAGEELGRLARLPVIAVGQASADAARRVGLTVRMVGMNDAASVVAEASGSGLRRLLHLAGREHVALPGIESVVTYASEALPVSPDTLPAEPGTVALIHSARAATTFAALASRELFALTALSPTVAAAAGEGWRSVAVAPRPTDDALVALVLTLAGLAEDRVH